MNEKVEERKKKEKQKEMKKDDKHARSINVLRIFFMDLHVIFGFTCNHLYEAKHRDMVLVGIFICTRNNISERKMERTAFGFNSLACSRQTLTISVDSGVASGLAEMLDQWQWKQRT